MTLEQFEIVLDRAVAILTENVRSSKLYHGPDEFAQHALDMLRVAAKDCGVTVSPTFHPHAFPDIKVNGFGVEVKYSKRDTWNAVGNSIFEGMRDTSVSEVYVLFGKIGGSMEVRWGRYKECVAHVRVSNSPRFVVDMDSKEPPLFDRFDISYDNFVALTDEGKMKHVREYWRKRLPPGEHLWWLEPSHTLPLNVRLYMHLSQSEKRMLRAEAALLCPQVCKPSRARKKYEDAAVYLLTYHGVFCPQVRDLFTAGSVQPDEERGGNYLLRALQDIEDLMLYAAKYLDNALFVEYWDMACPPDRRIKTWLHMADGFAKDWRPSAVLFRG